MVTHPAGPGRGNLSAPTKAGQASGSRRGRGGSSDAVVRRSHQQKPGGGGPSLCCLLLRAFLKYNIVILSSWLPARGREILPSWVDMLEASRVPVSCCLPPPCLTPGLLQAVIQGQGSHSFGLIVYVVVSRRRGLLNAVVQRVGRELKRDCQDAPEVLPQGTGHRIEGHGILSLRAPRPWSRHRCGG